MSGVAVGDVLRVQFPAQRPPGHEQTGSRPAVVVGVPDRVGAPRFPALIVVPLTSNVGAYAHASPALYPVLRAGQGGLTAPSVVLVDNVRALGVSRIMGRLGTLSPGDYAPIRTALTALFEL